MSLKKQNPKDVMSFTRHDIGHNPTKLKITNHLNLWNDFTNEKKHEFVSQLH
jgi:hypothetical protein